jgi:hypothetical protein
MQLLLTVQRGKMNYPGPPDDGVGMASRVSSIVIGLFVVCAASPALAQTAGPPAGYELDSEYTTKSPDGATTVEQYMKKINADGDLTWQFWAKRADHSTLLAPEQPDYAASFRFTNDSQWLVRSQKTGSGEASLYLYKLGPQGFAAATTKPLSDLAWAYLKTLPDYRKIMKPNFHEAVYLVKGVDDNYHAMGEDWPANRYLVISINGEVEPTKHHGQILSLRDWECRYDLQTGKFDVPPDFAANNAKATAPPPK